MQSVPRKLALGLILAAGVAACGDDVTVQEQPQPTPVVRSVVVSPLSASIAPGNTFQFGAAVDADAGLVNTVTWSASGGTGVTVDQNGLATASATATGVSSICATSTANTAIKGCAQLTITPAPANATVEISAISVGCDALAPVLQPNGVCGLLFPVATNNVAGQIDVQVNVNRPQGSSISSVTMEVLGGANFATVEATQTLTLTQQATAASLSADDVAAQTGPTRVVFSLQTAEYTLAANNAATVKHLNGQKKIRVKLAGSSAATSVAETQVTFRNANGFHVTAGAPVTTPTANNANGVAVRQTSPTGFSWFGGTPLTFTVSPVNYTGVAITGGASAFFAAFGTGCNIGAGPALRTSNGAALTSGVVTGTLTYSNNPLNAAANNVDGYEMNPACSVAGEVPSGNGIDATGNAFVTLPLGGPFGPLNTLNNPINPVVPTLPTVATIRLDNMGPNPIPGYVPNPNGRLNGWLNGTVKFDKLNLAAVLASGNPTQIAAADPDGIIAPTGVGNNLPIDNGFGGTTSFRARGGGTIGGTPCNAPVGQVPFVTPANCATFAARTSVTSAPALAETPDYFTYGLIVQSIDAFGNGTNPPAINIANPFDAAHPLVFNGVMINGVDITAPTLAIFGGNGSLANTGTITQLADGAGVTVVGANDCLTQSPAPFTTTALPNGQNPLRCWQITAQDQATGLPAIASGIATIPGTQGELWVSQQRRDGSNVNQFWCPAAAFPANPDAGAYQTATTACANWLPGTTTFNRAAGSINPAPIAGSIIDAYYGLNTFTRDQAGNQSTNFIRQFVHDITAPTIAQPQISPSILPATGTVTLSAGVFDNLDVGRAVFGVQFPSLAAVDATAPQYIRLPWANKTTGAANPTGWLFEGPSTLFLTLSSTMPVIKTLEVVAPCVQGPACFPLATVNASAAGPTGAVQFPGTVNPAGTQAGSAIAAVVAGAQSVARHTASVITAATPTAVPFAATGLPGGAGWFASAGNGTLPPAVGMGWAVINPSSAAAAGNIDISGNANNSNTNSKTFSAVAIGHVPNTVLANPFPGGVKFYAIDTRQNPTVFTAGAAAGTALIELCTAGTPLNDQVANSWTFSCTVNPGSAQLGVNYDAAGFSNANAANLFGPNTNQGHLGPPYINGVAATGTFTMPTVAIGIGPNGQALATIANTNTTYVR